MYSLPRDLRFAARTLLRAPAFSLAVVVTLAIGIAAAIAVFAALEAALLRPLSYAHPEQLVLGRTSYESGLNWTSSAQDFDDLRQQVTSLHELAAISGFTIGATVTGTDEPLRVNQALSSLDLFTTLGVDPVIGRHFSADEAVLGGPDVLMLSHGLWQRIFEADPAIVGRSITIDGRPTTIVGVMPPGFRFLYDVDLWRPMQLGGHYARARRFHNWVMVGRLLPGTTLQQAQQEVDAVAGRLAALYPDSNEGKGFHFDPLREVLTEQSRDQLWLLAAAVGVLLLISSGNVAGLLLVRGATRRQELALRAALGAPRARLAGQLLLEGIVLALVAGLVGLAVAQLSASALLHLLPLDALGIRELTLNGPVVAFALLLAVTTAAVFTLVPALRASRVDPGRELGAVRSTGSARAVRFRAGLVVAQIALTVVLLGGAGLLLRSLSGLQSEGLGFDADNLLAADVQLPRTEYSEAAARVFFQTLIERAQSLPDVEAAGMISQLPVRDPGNNIAVHRAEDFDPTRPGDGPVAYIRAVYPGYFAAIGIPLRSGRDVESSDTAGARPVVVINQTLAALLFGNENPVGSELAVDAGDGTVATIVGVVGDVKINGPGSDPEPAFYFPAGQWTPTTMRLALRTRDDSPAAAAGLRALLRELDPQIPLDRLETMNEVVATELGQRRVLTSALLLFAAAALTLAGVGLYGVLAEGAQQRRREIGVRMALGAARQRVVALVVREGAVIVGSGLVLGLVAAVALSRMITGLLYDVSPYDPLTLLVVTVLLGTIGLIAVAIPATRASRVDPAIALRSE